MPRDASGNYTLPAGNPVQSGSVIESTWANNTMNDLAAEVQDSLNRSGKGGMLAALPLMTDGFFFQSEPTSRFYRQGAGDYRFDILGRLSAIFEENKTNNVYIAKVEKDTNLDTLVSTIGATVTTVLLYAEQWPVAANLTVPDTLRIIAPLGVDINIPSGITLTVKHLDAGPYTVFSGDGEVAGLDNAFFEWFGAQGENNDDTTAIEKATKAAKVVQLLDDIYGYTNTTGSFSRLVWRGPGTVQFTDDAYITIQGPVDVRGVTFAGEVTAAQYTDGVSSSAISTAFDTPEYLDNTDTPYAGGDFTHNKVGDVLTTDLASLTGTERRSVQSDFITLVEANKYVVHVDKAFITDYANFAGVTIRRYNASNTYLGDYVPNASSQDLSLTNTAKIKIRVQLRRTADMPTTNPTSTVLDFSKIQFFLLQDKAATLDLSNASSSHILCGASCNDPVFDGCTFQNIWRIAVVFASCKRARATNNKVIRCWKGLNSTSAIDTHFEGNVIDLRQLHTNGNLYNQKFNRAKCLNGTNGENLNVVNNFLLGAPWAIEFTPMSGFTSRVNNNTIYAEHTGISLPGGEDAAINNNAIWLAPGWSSYGVEIPSLHRRLTVNGNQIRLLENVNANGYGIGVTGANLNWEEGVFDNNDIDAPIPMWINSISATEISTIVSVRGNTLKFGTVAVFLQRLGAVIQGNQMTAKYHMYSATLQQNYTVRRLGHAEVTIADNTIRAASEGAVFTSGGASNTVDNRIHLSDDYPAMFNAVADAGIEHLVQDNVLLGTAQTNWYTKAGTGRHQSHDNRRKDNGNLVLLGEFDSEYIFVEDTSGVGTPPVHTLNFTLPEYGVYYVSSIFRSGGDSNNLMSASWLLRIGPTSGTPLKDITEIGITVFSVGSPLVDGGTLVLDVNQSTRAGTVVATQIGGSPPSSGRLQVNLVKATRWPI